MATNINEESTEVKDLSGGIQSTSTQFLARPNQVEFALNVDFSKIGGIQKIRGYTQLGNTITTLTTTSSTTSTTTSTSTSTSSSTSTSTSTSSTTTA